VSRSRRARSALAVLLWAAAVLAATLVGMTAVGAIGIGMAGRGGQPLTPAQVDAALAAARSTEAAPQPAPSAPGLDGAAGVVTSEGGTVVARCGTGGVEIVSVIPAQGFQLDDEQEGGRVRFESDDIRVHVHVRCSDGHPVGEVHVDDD
jgi:hypothetical protein